eukprot:EG_transcript_18802
MPSVQRAASHCAVPEQHRGRPITQGVGGGSAGQAADLPHTDEGVQQLAGELAVQLGGVRGEGLDAAAQLLVLDEELLRRTPREPSGAGAGAIPGEITFCKIK